MFALLNTFSHAHVMKSTQFPRELGPGHTPAMGKLVRCLARSVQVLHLYTGTAKQESDV